MNMFATVDKIDRERDAYRADMLARLDRLSVAGRQYDSADEKWRAWMGTDAEGDLLDARDAAQAEYVRLLEAITLDSANTIMRRLA